MKNSPKTVKNKESMYTDFNNDSVPLILKEIQEKSLDYTETILNELYKVRFQEKFCGLRINGVFAQDVYVSLCANFIFIECLTDPKKNISIFLPLFNVGFRKDDDEYSDKYIISIAPKYESKSVKYPLVEIYLPDGNSISKFASVVAFEEELYKQFYTSSYEVSNVGFVLDNINCLCKVVLSIDSIKCVNSKNGKLLLSVPRNENLNAIFAQNYPANDTLQNLQIESRKLYITTRNSIAILDFNKASIEEDDEFEPALMEVKTFLLYTFAPIQQSAGIIQDVFDIEIPEIQEALKGHDLEKLLDGGDAVEDPSNPLAKQFYQTEITTDAENFASMMQEKIDHYFVEMKKEEKQHHSQYEIEKEINSIAASISADLESTIPFQTQEKYVKHIDIALERYESLQNELYSIVSQAKAGETVEIKVKFGLTKTVTYEMFIDNFKRIFYDLWSQLRRTLRLKFVEGKVSEHLPYSNKGTRLVEYAAEDEFCLIVTPCYPVINAEKLQSHISGYDLSRKSRETDFIIPEREINSAFLSQDIPSGYLSTVSLKYMHDIIKKMEDEKEIARKITNIDELGFNVFLPKVDMYSRCANIILDVSKNKKQLCAASLLLHNLKGTHEGSEINYKKFGKNLRRLKFNVRDVETVIKLYPIVDIPSTIVFFNHLLERDAGTAFFNAINNSFDFIHNNYESDSMMSVPGFCRKMAEIIGGAATTPCETNAQLLLDYCDSPIVRIVNNMNSLILYDINENKTVYEEPKVNATFALDMVNEIEKSVWYIGLILADFIRIISYPLDDPSVNIVGKVWDHICLITPKVYNNEGEYTVFYEVQREHWNPGVSIAKFLIEAIRVQEIYVWAVKYSLRTDQAGNHSWEILLAINQLDRMRPLFKQEIKNEMNFFNEISQVFDSVLC